MIDYNFSYLSFGAGRQSSTIAEMIVEGEIPPVNLAIFADTQNEPDWVYKQVEYLRGRLALRGIPLDVVTVGNIYNSIMAGSTRIASIPVFSMQRDGDNKIGRLRRQCTREYKIAPI